MQITTKNFSLKHTIESGQFFRYKKIGEYYYIISQDKFFKIKQQNDQIEFDGANRKFVEKFLGLEQDFDNITRELKAEKHVTMAMQTYNGLRILEQHPWEALISFICSSASNIPKITMNVNLLAQNFGTKINFDNQTDCVFPAIGSINDFEKIKNCKVGFRAKYILEANKISQNFFEEIEQLNYQEALQKLTTITGVGEKIADCVLLFGCKRLEAFPVDVWIKRVTEELYFQNKEQKLKDIKKFGQDKFGKYAGYANQYLYHWRRNLDIDKYSAQKPSAL